MRDKVKEIIAYLKTVKNIYINIDDDYVFDESEGRIDFLCSGKETTSECFLYYFREEDDNYTIWISSQPFEGVYNCGFEKEGIFCVEEEFSIDDLVENVKVIISHLVQYVKREEQTFKKIEKKLQEIESLLADLEETQNEITVEFYLENIRPKLYL